jgi:hypothetical protein
LSQFNSPVYDIARPTGRCAFSDQALEPGQIYYAALVELSDDDLQQLSPEERAKNLLGVRRLDVAADVWEQGQRPERLFSFWKTTVPEPSEKKKVFVDDAVLMNLLERLGEESDPQRLAFRHVLALILMRKKLLRYDGADRREDGVYWLLTPKADLSKGPLGKWDEDRQFAVLDPKLDAEQIRQVTEQLGQVLEGDF